MTDIIARSTVPKSTGSVATITKWAIGIGCAAILIAVVGLVIAIIAYVVPPSVSSSSKSGSTSGSGLIIVTSGVELLTLYTMTNNDSISSTPYTITFDTPILSSSTFDGTTFTSPTSGYYVFTGQISYGVLLANNLTTLVETIFVKGSTTVQLLADTYNNSSSGSILLSWSRAFNFPLLLNEGDTIQIHVSVNPSPSGSATYTVAGGLSTTIAIYSLTN